MDTRSIINRAIILSIFSLAGFLLARSIYYGSIIGVICALIGIIAWSRFLYKLNQLQSENDPTVEESRNY